MLPSEIETKYQQGRVEGGGILSLFPERERDWAKGAEYK